MKRARRIVSHHGSDCPDGPHPFRHHRCLILTRIDRPGQLSEAWVSGDCAETMPKHAKRYDWQEVEIADWKEIKSERLYRKRHSFNPQAPVSYGGGFWQRVEIPPQRKDAE